MRRKSDKDEKKKLRKKKKKHRYDKWDFFSDIIEFIIEVIFDII